MNFVLKLSKLCNLRCNYCYEYAELAHKERMPLEGLAYFFASLAAHYQEQNWQQPLDFALHGGEPLLMPADYLRALVALQQQYLGDAGIPFRNAVQTNLYQYKPQTLQACVDLGIAVGVSLDVSGAQRVDARGVDSNARVIANLDALLALPAAQRPRLGGISVLHSGNLAQTAETFRFFHARGLDYRILPIFSMVEPPVRMAGLMLEAPQIVQALQAVTLEQFRHPGASIKAYPIADHLHAAVRFLSQKPGHPFKPEAGEWALIINTNGDTYNHAEAYDPAYRMGNVFTQPLTDILSSAGRRKALDARRVRSSTCEACPYGGYCSRLPVVEAIASERTYDESGSASCEVARPMIDFMAQLIRDNQAALAAIQTV